MNKKETRKEIIQGVFDMSLDPLGDLAGWHLAEIEEAKDNLHKEYEDMANRFSKLLWHLTDTKMSKTNYTLEAMLGEIGDVQNGIIEKAKKETKLQCEQMYATEILKDGEE